MSDIYGVQNLDDVSSHAIRRIDQDIADSIRGLFADYGVEVA